MTEEKKRRRPRVAPVRVQWSGEAFVPATYELPSCDREYVVGEVYYIRPELAPKPSTKFEAMFHATMKSSYDTMSDEQRRYFPSADHLRHFLLIELGYCYVSDVELVSEQEARRFATNQHKTKGKAHDPYVRCLVHSNLCRVRTAFSMAHDSETLNPTHNRKGFKEAAEKILEILAGDLGVTVQEMIEAGRSNA